MLLLAISISSTFQNYIQTDGIKNTVLIFKNTYYQAVSIYQIPYYSKLINTAPGQKTVDYVQVTLSDIVTCYISGSFTLTLLTLDRLFGVAFKKIPSFQEYKIRLFWVQVFYEEYLPITYMLLKLCWTWWVLVLTLCLAVSLLDSSSMIFPKNFHKTPLINAKEPFISYWSLFGYLHLVWHTTIHIDQDSM